jgi:glycosyltransferase involved in cell wall biosynthesis
MRINIVCDASQVRTGGGVQVLISLMQEAKDTVVDITWILNSDIRKRIIKEFKVINTFSIVWVGNGLFSSIKKVFLLHYHRFISVKYVVLFGPSMIYPKLVNKTGFALPTLLDRANNGSKKYSSSDIYRMWWFSRVSKVFCETDYAAERFIQRFGIHDVSVIRNCINQAHNKVVIKARLKKPSNKKILTIFVPSSYYAHKNLECIPAISLSLQKNDIDHVFIMTTIKYKLNLNCITWPHTFANIEFVGEIPLEVVKEYYNNCDVVLLPSSREVSSAVIPEAWFYNKPLILEHNKTLRLLAEGGARYAKHNDVNDYTLLLKDVYYANSAVEIAKRKGEELLIKKYITASERFSKIFELNDHKYT